MILDAAKQNLEKSIIRPDVLIQEGIAALDKAGVGILVITDNKSKLIGVVTDGNIRRAILKGIDFSNSLSSICTTDPLTAPATISRIEAKKLMDKGKTYYVNHLPLLDETGRVQGLLLRRDLDKFELQLHENFVVIMAGGMGTRLMPLTEKCPKPLLKIGEKPILETIIKSFKDQGFYRFYISVNYHAEMIKEYFKNGSNWDVEISYLQEDKPLGTAGALSLMAEKPDRPFFVMNADLLTKIDFENILEFHVDHQAHGTMCVRQYDYQIPYGVVRFDGVDLLEMEEKPIKQFFVNAGIYVLSPESLDHIPADQFFDMPSLFKILKQKDRRAAVFPIHEYWMDIGQIKDFERANGEYPTYFSGAEKDD